MLALLFVAVVSKNVDTVPAYQAETVLVADQVTVPSVSDEFLITSNNTSVIQEAGIGWWTALLVIGVGLGSRIKLNKETLGNLALFALSIASIVYSFISTDAGIALAGMTILPAKLIVDGQDVPPLTRAQKKLYDYVRMKGNIITLDALAAGAIKWDNITYYIRKAITGLSGRQPLINAATTEAIGVCNLDKGQLPQYYNFCYDRIEVGYTTDNSSASLSPGVLAGYSSVLSSMDDALRNGELIIQLNREVQVESPVTDYGSKAAVSGGGALNFDGGELADPQVWQEQLQVEVDINLSATVPSAANTTYAMEVLFKGVQARLR